MEVIKNRHATYILHCHLVFVTKYRYKIFKKKHIDYLREIFKDTMKELGGEEDHIHLLVTYPPKLSVSVMVNTLKGRSSRLLRRDMPEVKNRYYGKAGLWHRSYFAGSVGGAPLEIVKQYIQQQNTPH